MIEEAVAALVFNHAKRLDHFSACDRVDYSLLKAIRELTLGYEVDACPLWMWERAILQGFRRLSAASQEARGNSPGRLEEEDIDV